MTMKCKEGRQSEMWIATDDLPVSPGHVFYERLNDLLSEHGFDRFVEEKCEKFYHKSLGRPSVAPGVYFRMLLVGFFEGIDSERGIAWRSRDSLSLREFLGFGPMETTPDHSSLSVIRRRLDLETHDEVFGWVLKLVAEHGLLRGKTLGVDASTLEANAALRSIVRRDTGESYTEFLTRLAVVSGIETPTREDLARLDRKRKNKGSNKDWRHPHDPDARIAKMKDGRTHLAHKVEHAVDLETGAIVAVTLQGADLGDTTTIYETTAEATENLHDVKDDPATADLVNEKLFEELAADKGYHSNDVVRDMAEMETRSYIAEPERGRRKWKEKAEEQAAVYANRRRIRGKRGKALQRKRSELVERPFAHCYDTGGMRRTHLKKHENILKRLVVHVAGFNLALVMRSLYGHGKPRCLQGLKSPALRGIESIAGALSACVVNLFRRLRRRKDTPPGVGGSISTPYHLAMCKAA